MRTARNLTSVTSTTLALAIWLPLVLLIIPEVISAGRVLFPGSEVRPGVRSGARAVFSPAVRSEVRPGHGGSEGASWLWRGSTRAQSERLRLLSARDPSRRPLQDHRQPTRPTQRLNSRLVLRQNVQLVESQPAGPRRTPATPDHRPAPEHPVASVGQLGSRVRVQTDQDRPLISVPSIPSVSLEGLSPAPNENADRPTLPEGRETLVSSTTSRGIAQTYRAPPTPAAPPRPELRGEDVAQILTPVTQLTSPSDVGGTGRDPGGASFSTVVGDVTVSGGWRGRQRGGRSGGGGEGREGRRAVELVTDSGNGWTRRPSSEVITNVAPVTTYTVTSPTYPATETSQVSSLPVAPQSDVHPVTSHKEAHPPAAVSQANVISVTSQTRTLDSGSSPVYYNNDVIGGGISEGRDDGDEGPQETREPVPPRNDTNDTNTARILTAIASLKGGDRPRHLNEIEDNKPDRGGLVIDPHRCPKLGGNLTLECRVQAAGDRGSVQRFWWGKRHFDLGDGRVGDELLAVDGEPFSRDRTRVQTVDEGHQRLLVSDVTAEDAGLYLCKVSRQGVLLKTEVAVVLCRR